MGVSSYLPIFVFLYRFLVFKTQILMVCKNVDCMHNMCIITLSSIIIPYKIHITKSNVRKEKNLFYWYKFSFLNTKSMKYYFIIYIFDNIPQYCLSYVFRRRIFIIYSYQYKFKNVLNATWSYVRYLMFYIDFLFWI